MPKHFEVDLVYHYHILVDDDCWDPPQEAIDRARAEHHDRRISSTLRNPDVATNEQNYGVFEMAACNCGKM